MTAISIQNAINFDMLTCYKCGVAIVVPRHFIEERKQDKGEFWCINGHAQAFVESSVDRLKKELAEKDKALANERKRAEWARQDLRNEQRSHAATKGQVTKLKKRTAAGVCPCCTRTFQNLQRHMKTKHPEYAK